MKLDQAVGLQAKSDLMPGHPRREQLPVRDDALLPGSDLEDGAIRLSTEGLSRDTRLNPAAALNAPGDP